MRSIAGVEAIGSTGGVRHLSQGHHKWKKVIGTLGPLD
jgi:hypothetical protein